jgi:hypothetical protein
MYINYLWTFDLYYPVRNAFDAGKSITWVRGRVILEILEHTLFIVSCTVNVPTLLLTIE